MSVSVKKNTIFNTIKSVLSIIFPLITFPYISRVLLSENVGKLNFGSSIVSYCSLFASLGVSSYAVRECSKVKDDKKALGKLSSEIISLNLMSTIIAYVVLAVLLIVAKPLANYRLLIIIQSSSIIFITLGADWLNAAMEDFGYITIRTIIFQILSLVLMFIFVHKQEDYITYAIISLVASSGANIVNIFYRRHYCKTRLTFRVNFRRHLPPILLLFSMIISQTIYCNSDITILGLIKGDKEVGLYSTAVKIYNIVNTLIMSVATVVIPQLSSAFEKKEYDKINNLLKYSLNYIIVLGLPCLVGINAFTIPIIKLLAGNEYVGASIAMHILTIALAGSFIGGFIGNTIMIPSGKEKICLRVSIISALVNIVLNLVFIPWFGLNAAAATTAVSEVLSLILIAPYIDKKIRISNMKDMLFAPVIGCLEIIIIGVISSILIGNNLPVAVVAITISAVAYISTLILLKNEFAMSFLQGLLRRLKK